MQIRVWCGQTSHESRDKTRMVFVPEGDTRGVVSRRKSFSRMQKSIGITIDSPPEYMVFTGRDRELIAQPALSKEGFR